MNWNDKRKIADITIVIWAFSFTSIVYFMWDMPFWAVIHVLFWIFVELKIIEERLRK